MHTDHFFRIGHGHAVCQDYAVSGMEPFPYAIVADGCSSSKNSEIGAMLLARIAVAHLGLFSWSSKLAIKEFASRYIRRMEFELNLDSEVFDATLGMISVDLSSQLAYVSIWGDGIIILIKKSGHFECITISYSNNAPFYLSYYANEKRLKQYKKIFEGQFRTTTITRFSPDKNRVLEFSPINRWQEHTFQPYTLATPYNMLDAILVSSDGLSSFREKDMQYQTNSILRATLPFKSTTGAFIQRRMNRLLKNFAIDGIFPLDDVSVAGIWLGDES